MLGEGPLPLDLEMFLLATGERGIGWQVVFGSAPLDLVTFLKASYMQQRVLMAATDEGKRDLRSTRALDEAIRYDEVESARAAAASMTTAPFAATPADDEIPPLDPAIMSPDEVRDWLRRYGDLGGLN